MKTKRLMLKLNQISSLYLGKIMYALFLMSILETIASFVVLSPVLNLVQNGANILQTRVVIFSLAFLAICVWLTFQFGFAIMLLKMSRREYTNLGFLFIGFRKFNPAGKVIMSLGALISILALLARFLARFIFLKINPDFSFEIPDISSLQEAEQAALISNSAIDTLTFIAIFLLLLFVISLVVLIRFIFVFQLHFDNPSLPVVQLFKRSAAMMKKNIFRLILFALRAGGKQLVIAIVLAFIVNFIPEDSKFSIIVFLLDMVYFINLYTAMVRIYLSIPIFYGEILNPTKEFESNENTNEEHIS